MISMAILLADRIACWQCSVHTFRIEASQFTSHWSLVHGLRADRWARSRGHHGGRAGCFSSTILHDLDLATGVDVDANLVAAAWSSAPSDRAGESAGSSGSPGASSSQNHAWRLRSGPRSPRVFRS